MNIFVVLMMLEAAASATAAASIGPPPPPVPVVFNATFSSNMVLQRDAKAAVYGSLCAPSDESVDGQSVQIKVSGGGADYTVPATVTGDGWLAYLKPMPASKATFTITAVGIGCANTTAAILDNVVFGDVW
jgi:hypothetical protein